MTGDENPDEQDVLLHSGFVREPIKNKFKNIIDFSGSASKEQLVIDDKCVIVYCDNEAFDHRRIRQETVEGIMVVKKLSLDDASRVLVKTEKGMPLLVWEKGHGTNVIMSSVDMFDPESPLYIRRMDHIDWLWHCVELICGVSVLHKKWSGQYSWRFDDVIGDADFNILQPMGVMAGCSLLAADINELRKDRFYGELLPLCGEVCVHSLTHYKYTATDSTVLAYMEWEGDDLREEDLALRLKEMDAFLDTLPEVKRSRVISPHGFQVGANAEERLFEKGIRYIIAPFPPGEPFTARPHPPADFFPYSSMNYHFTPRESGLYLFYNLPIKREVCMWGVPSGYSLSVHESSSTDFLYGLNMFEPPDRYLKPLDKIIAGIAALREEAAIAGFPLILFTHETALGYLGKEGWTEVCIAVRDEMLADYECCKVSDILSRMALSLN